MTTDYTVRSDFVIPEVLEVNFFQGIQEKITLLNQGSQGCIQVNQDIKTSGIGEQTKTERYKELSSSVDARIDTTEDDPTVKATVFPLVTAAGYGPIQFRGGTPVGVGIDALTTGKMTRAGASANIGAQLAQIMMVRIRNNLVAAAAAAVNSIDTPSANCHLVSRWAQTKASASKVKFSTTEIPTLLAKMGDAMEKIKVLLMPSACYNDLVADQIANYKIDSVGGFSIIQGMPNALGRTVIFADIPALTVDQTSSYYDKYQVLGLGQGALIATIKADLGGIRTYDMLDTVIPVACARLDYYVQYDITGMTWKPGTIHNPTDAELAAASNWGENYDDHRACPLVMGIYNATLS